MTIGMNTDERGFLTKVNEVMNYITRSGDYNGFPDVLSETIVMAAGIKDFSLESLDELRAFIPESPESVDNLVSADNLRETNTKIDMFLDEYKSEREFTASINMGRTSGFKKN